MDPLPVLTPAGQAQAILTWRNLAHGFLSPAWKLQQAAYYNQQKKLLQQLIGPPTSSAYCSKMCDNNGTSEIMSYTSFNPTE